MKKLLGILVLGSGFGNNFLKRKFNTKIHKTLNQCDAEKNPYFELSD